MTRRTVAIALVLVMALASFAVLASDEDTDAGSTKISGCILDYTVSMGNTLEIVGDSYVETDCTLTVESGGCLIIAKGAKLTLKGEVDPDKTDANPKKSTLRVKTGGCVAVDGTLEILDSGVLENSSVYDGLISYSGHPAGVDVNGKLVLDGSGKITEITGVNKKSAALSIEGLTQTNLAALTNGYTALSYDKGTHSIVKFSEVTPSTGVIAPSTLPYVPYSDSFDIKKKVEPNYAFGYWVGFKLPVSVVGDRYVEAYLGDTHCFLPIENGNISVFCEAGTITPVTLKFSWGTSSMYLDATALDNGSTGAIAISEDGTFVNHDKKDHTSIEGQTFWLSENASIGIVGKTDYLTFLPIMEFEDDANDKTEYVHSVAAYVGGEMYLEHTYEGAAFNVSCKVSEGDRAVTVVKETVIYVNDTLAVIEQETRDRVLTSYDIVLSGTMNSMVESRAGRTATDMGKIAEATYAVDNPDHDPDDKDGQLYKTSTMSVSGKIVIEDITFTPYRYWSNNDTSDDPNDGDYVTAAHGLKVSSGRMDVNCDLDAKGCSMRIISNGMMVVNGNITNVTDLENSGLLIVKGGISATNGSDFKLDSGTLMMQDGGRMTIKDFTLSDASSISKLHGAYYVDDKEVFHLEPFDEAVKAVADLKDKTLYVRGLPAITKSTPSPTGVITVTLAPWPVQISKDTVLKDIKIRIDGRLIVEEGVTLTIDEGAKFDIRSKGSMIVVEGNMIDLTKTEFETKSYDGTKHLIVKAGMMIEEPDRNIYGPWSETFLAEGHYTLYDDLTLSGFNRIGKNAVIDVNGNTLTLSKESELINEGIIDISKDGSKLYIKKEVDPEDPCLTNKGMIVGWNVFIPFNYMGTTVPIDAISSGGYAVASGFYVKGTIGDYEDEKFILSADLFQDNIHTLTEAKVGGVVVCSDDLYLGRPVTLGASKPKVLETMTIGVNSYASFSNLYLDGYAIEFEDATGIPLAVPGTLNGKISFQTDSGITTLSTDGLTGGKLFNEDKEGKLRAFMDGEITAGSLTVSKGELYTYDRSKVGTNGSSLNISAGARLIVEYGSLELSGASIALTVDGDAIADGRKLTVNGMSTITMINGSLKIVENDWTANGIVMVIGTLEASTEDDVSITVGLMLMVGKDCYESMAPTQAKLIGKFKIGPSGQIRAYPNADLSEALIERSGFDSSTNAKWTNIHINDRYYMTVYSTTSMLPVIGSLNILGQFVPSVVSSISIPGYTLKDIDKYDCWSDSPNTQGGLPSDTTQIPYAPVPLNCIFIGSYEDIYYFEDKTSAYLNFRIDDHVIVTIDGYRMANGQPVRFDAGDHTVEVKLEDGYSGTILTEFGDETYDTKKFTIEVDKHMCRYATEESKAIFMEVTADITDAPDPPQDLEFSAAHVAMIILIVGVILIIDMITGMRPPRRRD